MTEYLCNECHRILAEEDLTRDGERCGYCYGLVLVERPAKVYSGHSALQTYPRYTPGKRPAEESNENYRRDMISAGRGRLLP